MNSKNETHPAVALLDELLSVPSPPGREAAMADLVKSKIEKIGFKPETDPAGNVLVRLTDGKSGPPVILAAHIDEIALVVSRIEPDGRLRVIKSGGLMPHKIGERLMSIIGDDVILQGTLSFGSAHVDKQKVRMPDWNDVFVITGLSEEKLRAAGIHEGACLVPAREGRGPALLGDPEDPLLTAWTFDDRMGVVTLLRLLESVRDDSISPDWPMIVAFTVHEEGGCHGAKFLAHNEHASAFIAVDGCPVTDESRLKIDGRPGVWIKDKKIVYDHRLVSALARAAETANVEIQRAVYEFASSDASAVYETGGAPAVAFIGHVRENSHGFEVARLSVFDNVLKVLVALLKTWPGPGDWIRRSDFGDSQEK